MAGHTTGGCIAHRARWFVVAFVVVPTVLAGFALVWPGQRIADDLRTRAEAALAGAGLTGVAVTVAGRDAWLTQVPEGAEQDATGAVASVPGVRVVQVERASWPVETAPTGSAPTALVPTAPPAP